MLASPQHPIIIEIDDTNAKLVQEPNTTISPVAKTPPFPSRLTEKILPRKNQAALDFLE